MNSIIMWTIRQRRWSTIWWCLGVTGFVFLNMIFYPSFRDQAAQLAKTFEDLPDAAVQLFGGSTDFFSPIGFLNSQVFFLMLPLLLGILGIGLGTSLIAREEQDKTIETILARPISRGKLLVAKAISGTIIIAIVTIVGLVVTLVTARFVRLEVGVVNIMFATLACFLLTLSFSSIAFMLTTIGKTRGASLGITAFVALGGYFVSSLSGTVEWLKWPSKLFPFHYYHSEAALRGSFVWSSFLFLVAVMAICGVLSWMNFRHRDLA